SIDGPVFQAKGKTASCWSSAASRRSGDLDIAASCRVDLRRCTFEINPVFRCGSRAAGAIQHDGCGARGTNVDAVSDLNAVGTAAIAASTIQGDVAIERADCAIKIQVDAYVILTQSAACSIEYHFCRTGGFDKGIVL